MFITNPSYDDKENVMPEWHEPFPEPQTIPSGWDLSEILSASLSDEMDSTDASAKS